MTLFALLSLDERLEVGQILFVIPGFTCEIEDPDPLCRFLWDLALIRAGVWRVHARYGAEHCFSLVCGGRRARLVHLLTKLLKVVGSVFCFRLAYARFVGFICRLHEAVNAMRDFAFRVGREQTVPMPSKHATEIEDAGLGPSGAFRHILVRIADIYIYIGVYPSENLYK